MKEKDIYQKIQVQRNKLSLRTQLTLTVAVIFAVSAGITVGLAYALGKLIPAVSKIPEMLQFLVISFVFEIVFARFFMKIYSDPIQELRKGMKEVSEGNFDVQLKTKSFSKEIQELLAGFNMMTQELQSTEILQTDFVSNVSHEFKTPINAIEGYTTLLQGAEHLDSTDSAYIEKILFNTRRLSSLVSNILLLSKIENQAIQTDRQQYALDEQIREVLVSMEAAWEPKEIEFDVDLDSVSYYGNETLMSHVWSNLLSNAIKFSPQGGLVQLRLTQTGDQIRFQIEDRGPGIDQEAQKHIFDKFYQEDTSHKEEGNGLGLPLVKRILTNTDGSIQAENVPEGGCRFTVLLHIKKPS